jgi:hypothetical protein
LIIRRRQSKVYIPQERQIRSFACKYIHRVHVINTAYEITAEISSDYNNYDRNDDDSTSKVLLPRTHVPVVDIGCPV